MRPGMRWIGRDSIGTVDRMRVPTVSRTIVAAGTLFAVTALTACGGDDDNDPTAADPAEVASGTETEAPPTAPPSTPDAAGGEALDADDTDDTVDGVGLTATTAVEGGTEVDAVPDDPASRDDPTGTIAVGSETWEVAGFAQALEDGELVQLDGDFLICEADNPAFPGDANIVVALGDGTEFSFGVSDGEPSAEFGEMLTREDAADVEFERVDLTVTGTAEFPDAGTAEFDITCG